MIYLYVCIRQSSNRCIWICVYALCTMMMYVSTYAAKLYINHDIYIMYICGRARSRMEWWKYAARTRTSGQQPRVVQLHGLSFLQSLLSSSYCIYSYVCIYIQCLYIYIYLYIYICLYIYKMFVYLYIYMCIIYIYIYMYMYIYTSIYIYICTCVCVCKCVPDKYIHVFLSSFMSLNSMWIYGKDICLFVCGTCQARVQGSKHAYRGRSTEQIYCFMAGAVSCRPLRELIVEPDNKTSCPTL